MTSATGKALIAAEQVDSTTALWVSFFGRARSPILTRDPPGHGYARPLRTPGPEEPVTPSPVTLRPYRPAGRMRGACWDQNWCPGSPWCGGRLCMSMLGSCATCDRGSAMRCAWVVESIPCFGR